MKHLSLILFFIISLFHSAWAEVRPINEVPMYGGKNISSKSQKTNQKFIDWAVEEFGNLESASKDAADRGWRSFYDNDLNTAIKRFNQAWLLNPDNPQSYWGFGLVMGRRAAQDEPEQHLKESIHFLQMATEKAPENGRIIGDLAFSNTILGHYYKSEKTNIKLATEYFDIAGALFFKAFKADPQYPPIVSNWSVFYFYTEDYLKAKSKADEAISMGETFSPAYIKELEANLK